jgi:hypothetical protein
VAIWGSNEGESVNELPLFTTQVYTAIEARGKIQLKNTQKTKDKIFLTRGGAADEAGSSWGAEPDCSAPSSLPARRCLRFSSDRSSDQQRKETDGGGG